MNNASPTPNREITVIDSTPSAAQPAQVGHQWTQDEQNTLKQTVAQDCSDSQLKVFIMACQRLGLDPFARQIVPIVQSNKMTPQVTIDGLRLIAERTRKYGGQLGPYWCGKDGVWHEVWLEDGPPAASKVGVIRRDFDQPMWGVARFKSYNKGGTWSSMPDVMIAKVAESLALRKAFPQELSGIYAPEEMAEVEREVRETPASAPQPIAYHTTKATRTITPAPEAAAAASWDVEYRRAREMGATEEQWLTLRKGRDLRTVRRLLDNKERQIREEQQLAAGLAEEDEGMARMAGMPDEPDTSDAPEADSENDSDVRYLIPETLRRQVMVKGTLRKRLTALGYRTVAQVETFLEGRFPQPVATLDDVEAIIAAMETQPADEHEQRLQGLPVAGRS